MGAVVPNEKEHPVLHQLPEMFLKLGTYNAVAMELNRRGSGVGHRPAAPALPASTRHGFAVPSIPERSRTRHRRAPTRISPAFRGS
jgi:hypothetical protein